MEINVTLTFFPYDIEYVKDNFISANQQRTQVGNYNYQLTYSPAGRIGTKQCMHNAIDFVYGYYDKGLPALFCK